MIETIIFRNVYPEELSKQVNEFLVREQKNNAGWELKATHFVSDTGNHMCQLYFDRHTARIDEEDEIYGDY